MQNPGTGLTMGIPTLGRPVTLAWANAFRALNPPINYNMSGHQVFGKPVAEARNDIVNQALKSNHKYVFFLGDDVIPPYHTLKQLIYRMEHDENLGVVGGVYCSKSDPAYPLVFRENGGGAYWDWKIGEYFEVTGLGMDCTLIRTEVFRDLAKKDSEFFKTITKDGFVDMKMNEVSWTEDLYFLERVKNETKWKIYCDGSLICEHVDVYGKRIFTLPANSKPLTLNPVTKEQRKIVDLGSGGTKNNFGGENDIVITVDLREECNPDYRCDVRNLPFGDCEFDIVYSSHVLEHIPRNDLAPTLNEWTRILKEGGEFQIVLPNIEWAIEEIRNTGEFSNDSLNVLYGAQSNPYDFHMNCFTPKRLTNMMESLGFVPKQEPILKHYNMYMVFKRKSLENVENGNSNKSESQ